MNLSLIVAMSKNRVIGREGTLPWRLSADLRRFKQLTMGHHVVMGRKTYQSIGRNLPGRTLVIMTRKPDFHAEPGSIIVADPQEAFEAVSGDDQPFIAGGAEVYRLFLPFVNSMYVTRVETNIDDGDVLFPECDFSKWRLEERQSHEADERNEYAYTFEVYSRTPG